VGGLLASAQIAPCAHRTCHVPASAEIVIEGEILPNVPRAEVPSAKFTGYVSRRSTEHVSSRRHAARERPWFQSIGSGRAGDHITTPA